MKDIQKIQEFISKSLKEYRQSSQATRDSWLKTEKPERFLILDPDGNALSTPLGKLKTDASIRALHTRLRRDKDGWFINDFKNTPLAIYDTKNKEVVEVMYRDDNNYWQFAFNIASLGDNKQFTYMFDITPKNLDNQNETMDDIKKIQEFFSKSLNEATFKVGDKVTYLGHPGEITGINKEMTGAITYNVAYDKGNGRTKATNLSNKGGEIKPLNENKPVANVNRHIKAIQIQLDQLGVKYEMSGNPYKPFKAVYKPINKDDKWYDNFEDIVFRYNLGGVVKTSIKENNSIDYTKLISLIKSANNPRNLPIYYNSDNGVVNIGGVGYDKGELVKMFNSQPGQSLDIKNLFYKANQNPEETKNAIESMDPSIKVEIGYGYGNEPFVKYIKALMNEDFAKFDTLKMAINQHEKGEPYYDKTRLINIFNQLDNPDQERAKKEYSEYFGKSVNESNGFKSGKEFINIKLQKYPKAVAKINQLISIVGESNFTMEMAEWLFDFFNNASYESPVNEAKSEDKVDTITMDIPLFLRMLEYSREDAEQDLDLHDVTEKANKLGKERGILSMEDYEEIVGATEKVDEANVTWSTLHRDNANEKLLKQSKLSSAEYQKAKKLQGFKADNYKWNPDEDLYTKVNEGDQFKNDPWKGGSEYKEEDLLAQKIFGIKYFNWLDAWEQSHLVNKYNLDDKIITKEGKAAPYGSGYKPLEEKISEALKSINEELCPAGKAYIKRRKAAGEKSSAYLSGRAVKVCKGQMSGKSKKK
jgi:hypothetical protein